MRYISVPGPVAIINPITDEPVLMPDGRPETVSFARSVRIALTLLAQKGGHDAATLRDLRTKIDEAQPGALLSLSDDEWNILAPEFRRPSPQAFHAAWIFSAESHQAAVLGAPDKCPSSHMAQAAS